MTNISMDLRHKIQKVKKLNQSFTSCFKKPISTAGCLNLIKKVK